MDRFLKTSLVITLLFFSSQSYAKRILFASQFSLIPESKAHTNLGMAQEGQLNGESLKVLVWNIKKGQEKGLDVDLPKLGGDRDLILISEGYLSSPLIKLFESFQGIGWDMGVSFLYKKDRNTPTGTMIGSRASASEVIVTHTTDLEPFILTPKAHTMAKYPIAGSEKELLVISVHGINMTSQASFERHMQQAFEVIDAHDGPVIFAGDFNTRTKKRTKYLFNQSVKRGFQSVDFVDGHNRMKGLGGNYLDYSFVKGLKVLKAKVVKSKASDHQPMLFEVEVE